jgi:hypothetical protein
VDDTVVHTYDDSISFDTRNVALDLREYSGEHTIRFRVYSYYDGDSLSTYKFYVSNIHTNEGVADYSIIPTTSNVFLDGYIVYGISERKLFFSTESGYGSIDIDSKTLDYFYNIGSYVPLSSVLTVSIKEEISIGG